MIYSIGIKFKRSDVKSCVTSEVRVTLVTYLNVIGPIHHIFLNLFEGSINIIHIPLYIIIIKILFMVLY